MEDERNLHSLQPPFRNIIPHDPRHANLHLPIREPRFLPAYPTSRVRCMAREVEPVAIIIYLALHFTLRIKGREKRGRGKGNRYMITYGFTDISGNVDGYAWTYQVNIAKTIVITPSVRNNHRQPSILKIPRKCRSPLAESPLTALPIIWRH